MQQTMQAQQLRRMAERSAVAFLLAVLCVYPLYIDKFSNLGVVKFTGDRSRWLRHCGNPCYRSAAEIPEKVKATPHNSRLTA